MTMYKRGRDKEYRTVGKLREQGYEIAQRSAGSHSPIDIWAVNRTRRLITLVQCKGVLASENKLEKLRKELDWLNGKWEVEVKVM